MKFLLIFFVVLFAHSVFGQTISGIEPPVFNSKVPNVKTFYDCEKVDNQVERLLVNQSNGETEDKILHFGKELSTNLNFKKLAEKFVLPNGRTIYQYGIRSKNAVSLNLILEKFTLAEGANLFLVDTKSKNFIGAYSSANNNEAKVLGTEIIQSDEITVVLDEPKNGNSSFTIATVVHGFYDLQSMAKALNSSGDCHYDVNCPEGSGYELQRNSVALIVAGGGFCTGSLVHNTSGAIVPYFLSARHCGINPSSWVFRFRWESPTGQTSCATTALSGNGPSTMTVNGATMKANNGTSDFVLMELNTAPDPNWTIFYNGWDRSDAIGTNGVGIHHPDSDIKKISFENDPLGQATIDFNGADNRAWKIYDWDLGATEPGSSGSPLFNSDKRLVGVLSGGFASCSGVNDNNQPDYYGRFGYGWDNSPVAAGRLKDWLDPANTGVAFLDGIDPLVGNDLVDASVGLLQNSSNSLCDSIGNFSFSILNSGQTSLTQIEIKYGFNGNLNNTYNWTGNLATYHTDTITLSNISIPLGTNTFEVKVNTANATLDQDSSNNIVSKQVTRNNPDFTAKLAMDLDCYASETSWEIVDASGNVLFHSPTYSNDTQGTYNYNFCLGYGCYKLKVYDQYGDGMLGTNCATLGNGSYVLNNLGNGVILAQLSEANADFGDSIVTEFCVNSTNGIDGLNLGNLVQIFPNPGKDYLQINALNLTIQQVEIYSVAGQKIAEHFANSSSITISTSELKSAFYLVKIKTNKGEINQRWVKE